eukprot:TRINITY_DN2776_c1_g1_i8.p1 TRINITY_DN2776_c1_g1~~TRINITY_DN2776_c1_g1_i8.p1  ORF type:complete len:206 (-),score=31.29 TRINITY_DN2776_c1_g1_i8:1130-1747(-)
MYSERSPSRYSSRSEYDLSMREVQRRTLDDEYPQRSLTPTTHKRILHKIKNKSKKGNVSPRVTTRDPSEVLKSGFMFVNNHTQRRYCELMITSNLVIYCSDPSEISEEIDLRFKYLRLSQESILKRTLAPVYVCDEVGTIILVFQTESYDETEEWVKLIEALNFKLLNQRRLSDYQVKGGWLQHCVSIWIGTWNVGKSLQRLQPS